MAETFSAEDKAAFVMEFIHHSERWREQYLELWMETLENFTVGTAWTGWSRTDRRLSSTALDAIYLKDPETHRAIMTYAAKLVRAILGDERGEYVIAEPVGWEDAVGAAPTVSRLLRYAFGLPGHFRSLVEAVLDMLLFGTGIIKVAWRFEEMTLPVRSTEELPEGGHQTSFLPQTVAVHDDVDLVPIDIQDAYPDPGEYRIERMKRFGRRFETDLGAARQNPTFDQAAVGTIPDTPRQSARGTSSSRFRRGLDQPSDSASLGRYRPLVGYELEADVPWEEGPGSRHVVTVLDGVLVRDDPWPYADPELTYKTLIINPTVGRFYGIAPGQVIRYDQDFADVLKELIARAIIRQVHPPIVFDAGSEIDPFAIRGWHSDMPIEARGGASAVATLQYNANITGAQSILDYTKNSMQQAAGSLGAIQGEPGPGREAASVGVQRYAAAMDRPELAGMILEREALPSIARAILRRYQQFLRDEADLARRVGELPEAMWIGDIYAEFDVRFVGSRMAMSRQTKLQALDRLTAMASANPAIQALLPSGDLLKWIIGDLLELPELARAVGEPSQVQDNVAAMAAFGARGPAGNGVPARQAPPSLPAGQAAGGPVGEPS